MKKDLSSSDLAEILSEYGRQPRLINITEGGSKEVIPLGKAMLLIGRTDEANVDLDSHEISRNHASIVRLGSHYCLRDNGSTNGSYVNGERVKFKQLEHFDVIRFGPYAFLLDLGIETPTADGAKEAHAKIPPSHKEGDYTLTYNLESSSGKDARAPSVPKSALTVMTKGYAEKSAKEPKKRTLAICPNCKLEIIEPSYGVCSACGQKLF